MDIALIRQRDGNRCARCGSARDLHVHHRIPRSQGGQDESQVLVTLCVTCHRWAHGHPYDARQEGLLLRSWEDPALVPIRHFLWPHKPIWLGPELTIILTDPGQVAA